MRSKHSVALAGLLAALSITALVGSAGAQPAARASAVPLTSGLFAQMRGANDLSPTGARGAGDLNGYGAFAATVRGTNGFCYGYTVNHIAKPTMAHIHRGRVGVNGPVVVPLRVPVNGSGSAVTGCQRVEPALLTQIRAAPGAFYVNVHTGDFPAGAVRGQLLSVAAGPGR